MCAIDFSPRNYPKKSVFRRKSEKKFSRQNAVLPWFSGSSLIFHALKMCAIDFSPRNYPKKSVFRKKIGKKFFSIFREYAINVTPPLRFELFPYKMNFAPVPSPWIFIVLAGNALYFIFMTCLKQFRFIWWSFPYFN